MEESELAEYVEQSQSLIESSPQMDEQNTKRKLIEPLIELLGWEILSPEVELEYSVQMGSGTKKVDYALLLEDTPVVFVEAKGCDTALSDSHRRQLRSYMRQTGVDWGLLTNGKTFEILKRRTGGSRPDEFSLGTFSLDELVDHERILRTLTKNSIDEGESERIAEHIEATRKAAETLRNNKDEIVEQVTQVITREVGEVVSQTVEGETKQFVDSLASSLEQEGQETRPSVRKPEVEIASEQTSSDREWTPREGANAIAGTKSRKTIEGSDDDLVAVFPSKKSGVPFLKENNAWGFVRVGQDPKFVAMYVSEDVQQIKYIARVKEIVPAPQANLARPVESYSEAASPEEQAGFDPAKRVVLFEDKSLYELEDPLPFDSKAPMSLQYTTLGELKQASTTDDVL